MFRRVNTWRFRSGSWVECDSVPLDDRGFRYGMSVFETVAMACGRALFFKEHLVRLGLAAAARGWAEVGLADCLPEIAGAHEAGTCLPSAGSALPDRRYGRGGRIALGFVVRAFRTLRGGNRFLTAARDFLGRTLFSWTRRMEDGELLAECGCARCCPIVRCRRGPPFQPLRRTCRRKHGKCVFANRRTVGHSGPRNRSARWGCAGVGDGKNFGERGSAGSERCPALLGLFPDQQQGRHPCGCRA